MHIRHLVATAVFAAWLAVPSTTLADCQPAGPLAQEVGRAPIVFVGTAVETGVGGAPPAAFRVEEVWVGQLPESVRVRGLADDPAFGEDDRRWREGVRYLVVPIVDGNVLRDGICSATTEWRPDLAALRPATAPAPESSGGAVPLLPIVVVVAIAGLAVAAFLGFDRVARPPRQGP
jgi:hypothetical protein